MSVFVAHRDPGTPSGSSHPQHEWMYDLKFYTPGKLNPNLRVLEYLGPSSSTVPNGSYPPSPLTLKTMLLDTERRAFFGCSDGLEGLLGSLSNTTIDQASIDSRCMDGNGTYETRPYLRFAINNSTSNPSSLTYLQAESKEWAFVNDAPSVSLKYADTSDSSYFPERLSPFRTALTKRNYPTILKVCAERADIGIETLGPLSVVMEALNKFAIYISRPRVLSDG